MFLIALWLLLPALSGWAATPRLLKFASPVIEIDTVRYDAGPVTVCFECENISDKPVSIVQVHAQCGCTVPEFSTVAFRPGEKSVVKVIFNPASLFGEQERHLTVVATNGDYKKFSTITLHGYVDKGVTLEEIRYPYALAGGLRSDLSAVGMRLTRRGDVSEKEFTIYNSTDKALSLSWSAGTPVVIAELPSAIAPHTSAKVRVSVNPSSFPSGAYTLPLYLYADGILSRILLKGAVR